jgi:hexosaminidase
MKSFSILYPAVIAGVLAFSGAPLYAAGQLPIIPSPQNVSCADDSAFSLTSDVAVVASDESLQPLADVLAFEIQALTGLDLQSSTGSDGRRGPLIRLLISPDLTGEEYRLSVQPEGVTIAGAGPEAVARGRASLLQIIETSNGKPQLPCCTVIDQPDTDYRAILIDCARHEQSVHSLEQVIELASLYKIRFIQLHLTDDQSFTFPSTEFPQLTETSPWSFTREQLAQLVEYARIRGVTLIPEIEMPGHIGAFLRGLPECGQDGILNICREKTYQALTSVLKEVADVFHNSPYIHIGGDEVNIGALQKSPEYQEFTEKHNLSNPTEAYHYFVARMSRVVKDLGRRCVVWEGFHGFGEYGDGGRIPHDVIVIAWDTAFNPPTHLAAGGFSLINATWKPLYIVAGGQYRHPHTAQAIWSPSEIYRWHKTLWQHREPGRKSSTKEGWSAPEEVIPKVIGAQMCVWEQTPKRLIDDLHPRMAAFSQRLYREKANEHFSAFQKRADHVADICNTIIRPIVMTPDDPFPDSPDSYDARRITKGTPIYLKNRSGLDGIIRYTLDGSEPTAESPTFTAPIQITGTKDIRAALFSDNGKMLGGENWQTYSDRDMRVAYTQFEIPILGLDEMPDFERLPIVTTGALPGIRGPYHMPNAIGRVLTATFEAPETGEYQFTLHAPYGMVDMYFDNKQVFQRRPTSDLSPWRNDPFEVHLTRGRHTLRIDHVTNVFTPNLILQCQPPGSETMTDLDRQAEKLLEPLPFP